jgi:ParB family chromosome partitioning protein
MEATQILITDIQPDKNQPRKKTGFGNEEIQELANSIKEVGMIVPILIQKDNLIIDGERRWRAAKLIGLKKVPVVYNDNLTEVQRLEYQLIASLNATSCAEEEIAPKIKEYIDKSGFSNVVAATRLGKTEGYIRTMINQLADLSKPEKEIIKLWRETKGEKGIAPSNLAEIKQQHPDKINELIEIAKEEVVTRSEIRGVAKEKAMDKFVEEQKKKYEELQKSKDEGLKIIRTGEIIQNVRQEIINTTRELDRFFYKVKAVRFAKLSWKNKTEQKDFKVFVNDALKKATLWVKTLERIKEEIEYE